MYSAYMLGAKSDQCVCNIIILSYVYTIGICIFYNTKLNEISKYNITINILYQYTDSKF